jgi:anti-sigma-K factor RskA
MKELNRDELELIFDYCLGTADIQQREKAHQLIDSSPEAADFCSKVQASIGPLDEWTVEPCPDRLVESTISYVNQAVQSSQAKLGELLAFEESRTPAPRPALWVNIGRRLAMAAVFMIVGSVALKTIQYMRYYAVRTQCQAQLAGLANGISNYSADYNGRLPMVAISTGSPWWKVGDPGQDNVSNTRHIWLLVKGGYVGPNEFLCPGAKTGQLEPITDKQAKELFDFPNRKYIPYSLRLICEKPPSASSLGRKLIISDMNPLFENLPTDFGRPLELKLNDKLLKINSNNHRGKGQNLLFSDGSVQFVNTRQVGINNDDIFTLRGTHIYKGCEVPSCDEDEFMAP